MLQYAAAPAAGPPASSAAFAPLAAPGTSMAGAAAPDLAQMQYAAAAPGPSMQFQSLQQQDNQLYTSYATKKHKVIAGGEHLASPETLCFNALVDEPPCYCRQLRSHPRVFLIDFWRPLEPNEIPCKRSCHLVNV